MMESITDAPDITHYLALDFETDDPADDIQVTLIGDITPSEITIINDPNNHNRRLIEITKPLETKLKVTVISEANEVVREKIYRLSGLVLLDEISPYINMNG